VEGVAEEAAAKEAKHESEMNPDPCTSSDE